MTDQITVTRETWDAMREALVAAGNFISPYSIGEQCLEKVDAALTAANAVSDQDLPIGKCGVLSKSEPQAQGEVIAWEAISPVSTKYVTDKQYRSYSETAKRWYKPYKCSNCQAQATEPASCHQTGVCVRSGLAAENHARLIECAKRLVEHADFALGGILSADSKAKDIPSKAVSQVKSRHLAALRDALPAAPEAKQ